MEAEQGKAACYVPAYVPETEVDEQQERLAMLQRIPEQATAALTRLSVPNYHVDRTLREATLASVDQWQDESEVLVFTSSDKLKVHLGTPRTPLDMSEALSRIRELSTSTLLTARIVLGLWNIRRSNHQLAKDGSIALRLEEVLEWRGMKKRSYLASPGLSEKRYTGGYKAEYKKQVLKDLDLLASCCMRGQVTCSFKGKKVQVSISDPYLQYRLVTTQQPEANEVVAGVFVSPGAWINAYTEYDNYFLTEIDRGIFQLHPLHQQHELRLALYLTERWRQLARKGNFERTISMADLLSASMIGVDKANLTFRFVPRIQQAFQTLWERGILGAPAHCATPITATSYWGNAWLASQWVLLPPIALRQFYETSVRALMLPDQANAHKARSRKKGSSL
jgi:hypothetical protein